MIRGVERNQLRLSKSKKQMKELTDTASQQRLQQFNKNKYTDADRTTAQVTPQEVLNRLSQPSTEKMDQGVTQYPQPIIIPQTIVTDNHLNAYLLHPNLEIMKFVVDCIWRTVTHRNKGDDFILSSDNFIKFWSIVIQEKEDDIEIVLEESIIATHSCLSKQYKKKEIVRVIDVLIKNVSINTQDNVLWNSVEKLYRINKDLVRLSDVSALDIDPSEV
ncbi:MAG: hypothetical protein EZS28_033289 [Streblomastix strix]|uniref:Uncharacterized protein n=1 Tax=Streblomastix strix TaxID=222440 RepID=A0A5J4UN44_9EUKA|nr:MAG: hypothetical protein EZS28_033289 [Streblomastix strix]